MVNVMDMVDVMDGVDRVDGMIAINLTFCAPPELLNS